MELGENKIYLHCNTLMKAYKGCGFALLIVGIIFMLPSASIIFKALGCIPILFAVYLLTLKTNLEINNLYLIKKKSCFVYLNSAHIEPVEQYKCLELSVKSNYNGDISASSTN